MKTVGRELRGDSWTPESKCSPTDLVQQSGETLTLSFVFLRKTVVSFLNSMGVSVGICL